MCRIASLFLSQRLKGSMSGDARDFNNIETWAVIKIFFPLQGKAPKEIRAILVEALGEYAPSYATVKNWVAQFKGGDFSTCDAPLPGRPKTVTTLKIIDQINELILEDRRISAKSIAEQLGISRERVGSNNHEELDIRKLSAKWVPKCLNAYQKRQRFQSSFGIFSARSKWFPVAIGDHGRNLVISLWSVDKATISGVAAKRLTRPQKNSECKNPLEKFSPRVFGIKTVSSPLFIFQRAKLSTRSITHLCWCNWRIFVWKNAAGKSPRGSCSCTTRPRLTGHLQPRRNWPTWASNVLITHSILRIWSRRTTTCSLDWKKKTIESSPFFVRRGGHFCRGDVVGRTTFWFFF